MKIYYSILIAFILNMPLQAANINYTENCDTLTLTDGRFFVIHVKKITDDKVFFFHCDELHDTERSIHLKFVQSISESSENTSLYINEKEKTTISDEEDEWYIKEESGLLTKNQFNLVLTGLIGSLIIATSFIIISL